MNRAERRRQERALKKGAPDTTELEAEMIQPWSDVLMRVKLPQMILSKERIIG